MSHGGEEVGAGAVGDAMRETAARCRQARQEDPHKQSHVWGRSSNNTKSVHLGLVMVFSMSYSFRSDVRLFSFRPQVHQVGRDSEQPPRRGFPPRMFDECFSISLVTTPTNSRPGSTCKSCGHFKGQRL